ncbi:hypothetical protein B0H19DRAFT_243227 [Mycena capillaripes]|nr:hypothetical protein B0H19DRAFT_243227 [Mycena capillaripes]
MSRASKPCKFFQEGRCRYGLNCTFSQATPAAPSPGFVFSNTTPEPQWHQGLRSGPFGRRSKTY